MEKAFTSFAEQRAHSATRFEPFGINLSEVRRSVAHILGEIGKNGIFEQYTKHDISHIDEMLSLCDWIVDDSTKRCMSDADWLLITLSIYFHDMGMLVTREEYENRSRSSFSNFCNNLLFTGKNWKDYKEKVDRLSTEESSKFLYQEFVRHNHAARIRKWIEGKFDEELGYSDAIVKEIQRLIGPLDFAVRKDLALIAESHHLNDLDNFRKYKPVQAYGATDAETANVHFASIILRTVDLLHMRRDRTPSVLFRLISPTDPISQREWAKQNAVKRVMARVGRNKDGVPDQSAPKDTVEIHAHFTEDVGFFGLTSFLQYVRSELRQCFEWNEKARREYPPQHRFGWKDVSEDEIEAEGFLRKTFNFDIDTKKILDLLIGHTLYNDTSVVLRELVQNSLDAIRLQGIIDNGSSEGMIVIHWNSVEKILTVTDNGTGMTQDIIERHLLKAGSSRYQSIDFKENFPNFSPISRFGIGVLSAFMVSDDVEITTCSVEEPHARRIVLRSVHGRYLIRLIEKGNKREILGLSPHGTQFRLKVRASAQISNFSALARQWIIIPGCKVFLSVDNGNPELIGYDTPKSALASYFEKRGMDVSGLEKDGSVKIIEKEKNGITLAFGVRWSEYFKDWSLISAGENRSNETGIPSTCIEGIAVEFSTPGLRARYVPAIANATGKNAPKTNVARSTFELTEERETLLKTLYELYVEHVSDELKRMQSHYSETWAISNAPMLINTVLTGEERGGAIRPDFLKECIKKLPIFIIEWDGRRNAVSFDTLRSMESFYTIDSALIRSSEQIIKETAGNATISAIIQSLGDPSFAIPSAPLLCNINATIVSKSVEEDCEPTIVQVIESHRRVDVEWKLAGGRWTKIGKLIEESRLSRTEKVENIMRILGSHSHDRYGSINSLNNIWISRDGVKFICNDSISAVRTYGKTLIKGDIPVGRFLCSLLDSSVLEDDIIRIIVYTHISLQSIEKSSSINDMAIYTNNVLKRISFEIGDGVMIKDNEFLEAMTSSPLKIFDISTWDRRAFSLSE